MSRMTCNHRTLNKCYATIMEGFKEETSQCIDFDHNIIGNSASQTRLWHPKFIVKKTTNFGNVNCNEIEGKVSRSEALLKIKQYDFNRFFCVLWCLTNDDSYFNSATVCHSLLLLCADSELWLGWPFFSLGKLKVYLIFLKIPMYK